MLLFRLDRVLRWIDLCRHSMLVKGEDGEYLVGLVPQIYDNLMATV